MDTQKRKSATEKAILTVVSMVVLLVVLQLLREALVAAMQTVAPSTEFAGRMLNMCSMLLLTAAVLLYARLRGVRLSVFPERFGKGYIICTCVAVALLTFSPSHFTEGITAVALSFYGSVVTPVYEELVFRGFVWTRLESVLSKPLYTYILSILLFMLWHLGYVTTHIAQGNWAAVAGKLAAGLCYGAVLGAVRLKTHNCYSTILLHGTLNLFMV